MRDKNTDVQSDKTETAKYTAAHDKNKRASRYNYTAMDKTTVSAEEGFSKRLSELRISKGISARELSLSLGQGAGYINNIENRRNFPSMNMFFEICEYLNISPLEYFEYTIKDSDPHKEILIMLQKMDREDLELLQKVLNRLERSC